MVTHDMGATLKYATKVLHMGETPRVFDDTELYRNSELFCGILGEGEK